MKISGGIKENGVFVGNIFDKYSSRNILVRKIMRRFSLELSELVSKTAPATIHEIGCGEGYWVLGWNRQGIAARGSDFSSKVIELARINSKNCGYTPDIFEVRNIYELEPEKDSADLIVCCEVLEHLERPYEAMQALMRVTKKYVIMSVPREPVWCISNMLRGKYLTRFGNTSGHIQHWSYNGFLHLAENHFDVIEVRSQFPWTMLLCRV
jgi:2-polyprenyl-3-methyl-5-hydroxy-6-metoxy-1,4-benzoquinol methylase